MNGKGSRQRPHNKKAFDKGYHAAFDDVPSPGSDAAIALSCSCPILDNEHGRGYGGKRGVYVYNADCPLHGKGRRLILSCHKVRKD